MAPGWQHREGQPWCRPSGAGLGQVRCEYRWVGHSFGDQASEGILPRDSFPVSGAPQAGRELVMGLLCSLQCGQAERSQDLPPPG